MFVARCVNTDPPSPAQVSFDLSFRPQTLTPNANLSLTTTYAVQVHI